VAGEVFDVVLPFSVRIVRRLANDVRATLTRVLTVAMNVFDANHYVSARCTASARFHQNNSSVPDVELCPVAPHSDSQRKAEHVTKPFHSLFHVRIHKLGNYGASGDGSIR
jgi:hypothetical protein